MLFSRCILARLATNTNFLSLSYSTIYALSTALTNIGSPIAIVRVSGPSTKSVIQYLIPSPDITRFPRKAINVSLFDNKSLIDNAIAIYFPAPNSYTGEDICEFHVHGSRAIVSYLLNTIGKIPNCQPAKAGEFTRRAFINKKISLIEAEALSALISSKTEIQRKHALKAFKAPKIYEEWRNTLLTSIAYLESIIDFGETNNLDESILNDVIKNLKQLKINVYKFVTEGYKRSELITEGVDIAIIGNPNVGKSTLINKLCKRDLSIVSPISGTTRDVVEGWLNLNGWTVKICDTAGIKPIVPEFKDEIELEGIKRALHRAKSANIILYLIDAVALQNEGFTFKENDETCPYDRTIFVVNKIDLLEPGSLEKLKKHFPQPESWISCIREDENISSLIDIIIQRIEQFCGDPEECFVNERHHTHLIKIMEPLQSAIDNISYDLAISSHYLRTCIDQISQITGKITTEDILDNIFSNFCIGK